MKCGPRDLFVSGSRANRKLAATAGKVRVADHTDPLTRSATPPRQAAYPLIRISPFDKSTVPGAQTWSGFSQAYSGWSVISVTFSRR